MQLERNAIYDENEPLISKKTSTKRGCYGIFIALCLIIGCIYIIYPNSAAKSKPISMLEMDKKNKRDINFNRELITNNNNSYLCPADFVYHDVNRYKTRYNFACAQVASSGDEVSMNLTCQDGYALKCLVGASYGRTAGACGEIWENPNGCGIPYKRSPVKCETDSIQCDDVEFTECSNTLTGNEIFSTVGCTNCVGVCDCGYDAPLFYNVADCFGDGTSTVCTGEFGDVDDENIYLPQEVWDNDCEGFTQCTLTLENSADDADYSCYTEWEGETNVYYNAVNGVEFERFEKVVMDGENGYLPSCGFMDFKVLAVCEAMGSS